MNPKNNIQIIFNFAFTLFFGITSFSLGNPYEILGVSPNATDAEIIQAYRTQAKKNHPDVSELTPAEANRRFKLIQSAFESIQKIRKNPANTEFGSQEFNRKRSLEKESAKSAARETLETDLKNGMFGSETLKKLPMMAKKRNNPNGFHFGRGAKEDGEWEAISEFLKAHEKELLNGNIEPRTIKELLNEIDIYTEFTGESVKDIRSGLLDPYENYVLDKTQDRSLFLETLEDRLSRMSRAGAFPLFSASAEDSKKVFGSSPDIFIKKFSPLTHTDESPELQLAKEISALAFSKTAKNPVTLHELEYLIRSVPPALAADEKITFLADIMEHLETIPKNKTSEGAYNDFKSRVEGKIKRVFSLHPELLSKYAQKGRWWERLIGSANSCDILLGKIARNPSSK